MNDLPEWERVCGHNYDWTERLPVPGGWLYRNVFGIDTPDGRSTEWRVSVIFVAQPAAVFSPTSQTVNEQ